MVFYVKSINWGEGDNNCGLVDFILNHLGGVGFIKIKVELFPTFFDVYASTTLFYVVMFCYVMKKKKKKLWPFFMDGVQLPQG